MPRKRRNILLPLDDRATVYLRARLDTDARSVTGFMVQLESVANGGARIVIRFDTSHGYVHQHLFDAEGGHRRLRLEFKDWAQAYTYCYEYVKRNWGAGSIEFRARATMKRKEMVDKNLDLHYHLMMQLLRDPDSIDIPEGAETILLPEDDPEMREANLRLGKRREKLGKRVVYIEVKLVPETRTVMIPKLRMLRSA